MRRITSKRYACSDCGHEVTQSTNHYGETYSWFNYNKCPECGWKHPLDVTVWQCLETPPDGEIIPDPWALASIEIK